MSSTPLLPASDQPKQGVPGTPVGVDIGVKNLIAAATAGSDPASALVIEGEHIRDRHELLAQGMRALQWVDFDTTDGEAQLFAAFWQQVRAQIYEAAVRVVRYARQFVAPTVVLEDLSFCESSLWERRTAPEVSVWLLPTIQHAIAEKARGAGLPVAYVDPEGTTRECHRCGAATVIDQDFVKCAAEGCPAGEVQRDRSAAVTIAERVRVGVDGGWETGS